MKRLCFSFALLLSACANDLPDTAHSISTAAQNAPYPSLVPLDGLLAQARGGSQIEAATASLQSRAAFLHRKASALRGRSIVDGQDRMRLLNAR